jgi:hypothetical protein
MPQLTEHEKKIIAAMRQTRKGRTSAYDFIIFGNDRAKQKEMIKELQWQAEHATAYAMASYYGPIAAELLTQEIA